jgi:isocitrate/isopropylmalate dehydrogenase
MLLRHIGQNEVANLIEGALLETLSHRELLTRDLGGPNTTTQFTADLITRIRNHVPAREVIH